LSLLNLGPLSWPNFQEILAALVTDIGTEVNKERRGRKRNPLHHDADSGTEGTDDLTRDSSSS